MSFTEPTKLNIKRKSHFKCCLCHGLGVEIHHIIPQSEGGPDSDDNAAPLCPSCHETYGANPEKRKFIREARNFWYEVCEKRYAADPDLLANLSEKLNAAASKADLEEAVAGIHKILQKVVNESSRSIPQRQASLAQAAGVLGPGIGANRHCRKCNSYFGLIVGDTGKCPSCGTPWQR